MYTLGMVSATSDISGRPAGWGRRGAVRLAWPGAARVLGVRDSHGPRGGVSRGARESRLWRGARASLLWCGARASLLWHAGVMRELLREIVDRGQPAQAQAAAALLERLAANPDDGSAQSAAAALLQAYLHDPYLTRNP